MARGRSFVGRMDDGSPRCIYRRLRGRRRKYVYGRTREEARQKQTELLRQADRGVPMANRVWRVGDYLSYWLDEIARPRVRDSTYAKYETFVRCYLVPSLGRRRLGRLSTPDVRQFLKQMAASDKSSATVSGRLRRPASGVGGSGSRGPRVPERGGDGGPTQGGEA